MYIIFVKVLSLTFNPTNQWFFNAKKCRFEELLVLSNPGMTEENASVTLVYVDVPTQQNMWVMCVALMFIYVENAIHYWW